MTQDEKKELCFDLYVHFKKFRFAIKPELTKSKKIGLNDSKAHMLTFLYRHDEINMTKLSRFTSMQKASMTSASDSLIRMGLVKRHRSETDRRVVTLKLTRDGKKEAAVLINEVSETLFHHLNSLTEEEWEKLSESVDYIKEVAEKIFGEHHE